MHLGHKMLILHFSPISIKKTLREPKNRIWWNSLYLMWWNLSSTRELPGNAMVNFKLVNIHGKWQRIQLQWNSSPSKNKCLSYLVMAPWIELECAYVLTKVSSFQVRYLLWHFNGLFKSYLRPKAKDSHIS